MSVSGSRSNSNSTVLESPAPGDMTTHLATVYGSVEVEMFHGSASDRCLLVYKRPFSDPLFVRVQSACLFGEALGSIECDCKQQLDLSLRLVAERSGVIVYLFQEGRGLGLEVKIRGMALQEKEKLTSHQAYEKMGLAPDPRRYSVAGEALRTLGTPKTLVALTRNSRKLQALKEAGFTVTQYVQRH
jgi:GTP cyclohydrolase II